MTHRDNLIASISGFLVTATKGCLEMRNVISPTKLVETFILGMVGALGGFIFWQIVKTIKKLIKKNETS